MINNFDDIKVGQEIFLIEKCNWDGIERHIVGCKKEVRELIHLEFSNLTDRMREFKAGNYSKDMLFLDFDSAKEWLLQYLTDYLASIESGEEIPPVGDVEEYIVFLREEIPKLEKVMSVELSNY
jgi:hypothetical protein